MNRHQLCTPRSKAPLSRRRFLGRALVCGTGGFAVAKVTGPVAVPAAGLFRQPDESKALVTTQPWQIGCYTRPWDQHPYQAALDAIAEAGYRYVGLMTTKGKSNLVISTATSLEEAQRVGQEVKQRSLVALSVYGGDFPVAQSLDAGLAGLKRLIDNCAAVSAPNLMLGGTGDARLQTSYYRVVAECCEYAAAKGIAMSVKPHGGLNATGPQCRQIIERVGHRSFGLWYDPGNIFYYSDGKLDPVDDAATVDGLVMGMSVKDFLPPKEVQVTPGDGRVHFAKVLAVLKKGGFTHGPLIVECLARGDRPSTLAQARRARRFLQGLVGQPD